MKLLRYILISLAALSFMVCADSCVPSFTFNGASIDYTVFKTIQVGNFPIRAALVYPPLQQTFEIELQDYITRNTRLQTVDTAADLEIEGEITGYNLSPQAVTEDAYASKTRLTISVRIRYTNNKQENKDIDQTFSAYRDFDSSVMLTDVQDQLCQEICQELVVLIFNATLGDW